MSEGFNRVLLLGNLAADPELRSTQGGRSVLKFRLACGDRYEQNGEWKTRTEFIPVTVWGKRAESLAKILVKGTQVFVEGAWHVGSYEKDGQTRYFTDVTARSVILGGRPGRGRDDEPQEDRGQGGSQRREAPPASDDDGPPPDLDDSDLPF